MIKAAIMGYGTIGSGVAEILEENKDVIREKAGQEIRLKYVLDLRDFPDSPVADKIIHDFKQIEEDEEIRIVVEAMGGLNPAYPFVKACLLAGKHVATSNKALVAAHGTELLEIARQKQVNFFFEASVGGGIPIIRPLYRCLEGERIEEITGILNGTTNFILTKMDEEGESFEAALKEAQSRGYAERNPEADVEGYDTCRKIAILTAMAAGREVHFEDIYTEGITRITDTDFKYAKRMGTSIKLFGTSRIHDGRASAFVAPMMIDRTNPLYSVNDVFNGILVKGNMLGPAMFYGSGAGKLPTASAVIADMIEAAQNLDSHVPMGWSEKPLCVEPIETASFRYFVRIAGSWTDREANVNTCFGGVDVHVLEGLDEFAILTGRMQEGAFRREAAAFDTAEQAEGRPGIRQMIRAEM